MTDEKIEGVTLFSSMIDEHNGRPVEITHVRPPAGHKLQVGHDGETWIDGPDSGCIEGYQFWRVVPRVRP